MTQAHRQDWDRYWRQAGDVPVFGQMGGINEDLLAFWSEFFSGALADRARTRLLDMACGSGAVTLAATKAAEQMGRAGLNYFCLDYSVGAVADLRARMGQVKPLAADAGAAPFADAAFDVIASQFGLEYAGPDAFAEAARLVAPNGVFCAVCHLGSGPIHRECRDNFDAIQTVLDCRFLPFAKSAFAARYAMDSGAGTAMAAEQAHKNLSGSVRSLRTLIEKTGPTIANGLPARLHNDILHMYGRYRSFNPRDVYGWIDGMTAELAGYAGRMKAMTRSALDEADMKTLLQRLTAAGLTPVEPSKLQMGKDGEPGAWILSARHGAPVTGSAAALTSPA